MPDSPSLIPWLLHHPFSGCETHTHWPCSCIHIHRAATKVVFFACCFVTPFHWPPYLSKRRIQPNLYKSIYIVVDGISQYVQMGLARAQWVEQLCCAPGCCRKEHTPWASLQMSCRPLNHWQWLFVSSTTFPGVPRPRCCRIKDMHYSCDGQESEEPWGKPATGCQNSPDTPTANSSHPQPNCCKLQVASRNRLWRGGFRTKVLFFIILTNNGPLRSNLQIEVPQSSYFPFRSYIDSLSFISSLTTAGMCELSLRLF